MDIGTAFILGAATLWCIQVVTKDLKRADKRLKINNRNKNIFYNEEKAR